MIQKNITNDYLGFYIQIFLLAIAVTIAYGHTLDVPFYLDDFSSIQENPIIYQWDHTLYSLWTFAPLRIIGYLTFALNYQVHQFEVAGYHIVNIIIHFLASVAVFALLRGLMRTPALRENISPSTQQWLPLVIALLFLLHPLQIQAVTYIVQRLASLAALFYIASMACFIQARLASTWKVRISWTVVCTLLAICAFFTKQNTVTLPFALLLLEITFFPGYIKKIFSSFSTEPLTTGLSIIMGSSSMIILLIWIVIAKLFHYDPFSLQAMLEFTQETTKISRESYLATQFSVLWTYIGLFFYPHGLHIDYTYPLTESLLTKKAMIALSGHLLIISFGLFSLRRWPLVAFGILFYYLAHLVESSVIPINDVIFEHRTYLPNLGLVSTCGWLLVGYLPQQISWKNTKIITGIILLILLVLTWQRNQLWRDPIALWQQNLEYAPKKHRAWVILGKHLLQAGKPAEGLEALKKSATTQENEQGESIKTYSVEAILNLVVAHKMLGQYDEALSLIDQAMNTNINTFNRAKFLVNRGNIFYQQKRYVEAEDAYRGAIELYPQGLTARINLASIFGATDRELQAEAMYREVLKIDPNNQLVLENLNIIHKRLQRKQAK